MGFFLFIDEYPEVASCDSGSHLMVIRINECHRYRIWVIRNCINII